MNQLPSSKHRGFLSTSLFTLSYFSISPGFHSFWCFQHHHTILDPNYLSLQNSQVIYSSSPIKTRLISTTSLFVISICGEYLPWLQTVLVCKITYCEVTASAFLDIIYCQSFPDFYEGQSLLLVHIKHCLLSSKSTELFLLLLKEKMRM